jgi:hypothetical protein
VTESLAASALAQLAEHHAGPPRGPCSPDVAVGALLHAAEGLARKPSADVAGLYAATTQALVASGCHLPARWPEDCPLLSAEHASTT